MNEKKETARPAFIAKIIASFTHELKNHLAIIRESAGLMSDMIEYKGGGSEEDKKKYLDILKSIHKQTERSSGFITYLNRFSHRMDRIRDSYDINEALEDITVLMSRLANHRQLILENNFRDNLPSVYGNAAVVQFICYCIIEQKMFSLASGGSILVCAEEAGDKMNIKIISNGTIKEGSEESDFCLSETIDLFLKSISGEITKNDSKNETTLTIPLAISEAD